MKKRLVLATLALGLATIPLGNVSAQTNSEVSVTFTEDATPLEIISVDNFVFGDVEHNVMGVTDTADGPVNVEILDNNYIGAGDGWNLTATLSGFTDEADAPSLAGTTISLAAPTITSDTDFSGPAGNPVELSAETATVATADRSEATPDVGYGLWNLAFDAESIQLNVLEGASAPGTHNATVTWELTNGPGTVE